MSASLRKETRTDAWRRRLAAAVVGRGQKAELARHLADGDPGQFARRKVQIAEVLNQAAGFEAEFLLACEEWMARVKPDGHAAGRKNKSADGRKTSPARFRAAAEIVHNLPSLPLTRIWEPRHGRLRTTLDQL
jgi:hypothetical protein